MNWETVLNEKMEGLRDSFHEFIENGGTEEECVNLLNENLGYMGIHAYFTEPNSTNRIQLPSTEALAKLYANRQPIPPTPGYRTPVRGPVPAPVSRGFVTPAAPGTPFSPPRPIEPSRKRSRLGNILRNNNNRNNNARRTRKK